MALSKKRESRDKLSRVPGDEYFIDNRVAGFMRVREDAGLVRIQPNGKRAEDISDQNGSQ
ncbi:MAG TPA: hypothetical protein VL866_22245 [Pyrinomonadaceae bacterium]|nr:hypothetical protein [Pyrinomonadaceae bacterium]